MGIMPESEVLSLPTPLKASGFKVNIIALGDVGATLLLGLKLLGKPDKFYRHICMNPRRQADTRWR